MRVAGVLSLALALTAGPAVAQDNTSGDADPNLRRPQIHTIEIEGTQVQYVVGETAWGNVYGALARLAQLPEENSVAISQQLWAERDNNPPIFLMEVARRSVTTNPELAIEAYMLGRVRTIYDISRCLDSSSAGILNIATAYAGEEVEQLLNERLETVSSVLETMYSAGTAYTSQASPWWACSYGTSAYTAASNGAEMTGPEWLKVQSRWATEQSNINANLLSQINLLRSALAARDAQ